MNLDNNPLLPSKFIRALFKYRNKESSSQRLGSPKGRKRSAREIGTSLTVRFEMVCASRVRCGREPGRRFGNPWVGQARCAPRRHCGAPLSRTGRERDNGSGRLRALSPTQLSWPRPTREALTLFFELFLGHRCYKSHRTVSKRYCL